MSAKKLSLKVLQNKHKEEGIKNIELLGSRLQMLYLNLKKNIKHAIEKERLDEEN